MLDGHFEEFREILKIAKNESPENFVKKSVAMGAVLALFTLYIGLFSLNSEKAALLSLPAFFLPIVLNYFFVLYSFEQRKKELENDIPDVLFMASSMPKTGDIERLCEMAAKGNGILAGEFSMASREIRAGAPAKVALSRMKQRNKSHSLDRAIGLLIHASECGVDMGNALRETAEDFIETNSVFREQSAGLAIQKYTILAAGGILIPLIIGLVTSLVASMDFSLGSELGLGLGEDARRRLFEAASFSSAVYILEYSVIAAVFIGHLENSPKKPVLYFTMLAPLGLGIYFFARGF